ncbi:MAG: hypothetical protein ABS873_04650 [Alkalibacterium sp.]
MKTKTKAWISAGLLALTLIINAMGAFGWINDMSQQEVSDMYPTLITPAPSTFSIWSVIYTLLIISIIVMLIVFSSGKTHGFNRGMIDRQG